MNTKTKNIIPDLHELNKLSLQEKINLSSDYIEDWYNFFRGKVYCSFSGGLDSTVLLSLIRNKYNNVIGVFSDTGLEYPEIREFIKTKNNIIWVKPKKSFKFVINNYGYPVVSKNVSRALSDLRNPTENNKNTRSLRENGISLITQPNKYMPNMKLPNKWKFLINAPFKISDKCCNILKKEPLNTFSRKNNLKRIIGLRAEESNMREFNINYYGINQYYNRSPVSNPLAFWSHQDILKYILEYKLDYCQIYGDIIFKNNEYITTREQRTGCMFCMFGIHLEADSRFDRMKITHPIQYDYCMNKLNCKQVLDFIKNNG